MTFRSGTALAFLVVVTTFSFYGESKPYHHHEMDKVDACIFTCDYCFKEDFLVECANECLATEGAVGPLWIKTCPFFEKHSQPQQRNVPPFK